MKRKPVEAEAEYEDLIEIERKNQKKEETESKLSTNQN